MAKDEFAPAGIVEIEIARIDESYGHLRLAQPRAEAMILNSMRRFGQLTPVIVGGGEGGGCKLVDGFKRLKGCRRLGIEKLKARVLTGGDRVLKAAMVHINGSRRGLGEFEEALVVHSLFREDALTQVQIGLLVGRHKSWVCRRIGLIDRLEDEVLQHVRLGLVSVGIARELMRLPRGNQEQVLASVIRHRLGCRQTGRLVKVLLERPRWQHDAIVQSPLEAIEDDTGQVAGNGTEPGIGSPLCAELEGVWNLLEAIWKHDFSRGKVHVTDDQRQRLVQVIRHIEKRIRGMGKLLAE